MDQNNQASKSKRKKSHCLKIHGISQQSFSDVFSEMCYPPEPKPSLSYEDILADDFVSRILANYDLSDRIVKNLSDIYGDLASSSDMLNYPITSVQITDLKNTVIEAQKIQKVMIDSMLTVGYQSIRNMLEILCEKTQNQTELVTD